jgi:hypothetical protein
MTGTPIKETRAALMKALFDCITAAPNVERARLGEALENFTGERRRSVLHHPLLSELIDAIAEATDCLPMSKDDIDEMSA